MLIVAGWPIQCLATHEKPVRSAKRADSGNQCPPPNAKGAPAVAGTPCNAYVTLSGRALLTSQPA